MTGTTSPLSKQLMQQAVCHTDHPAQAATALLKAAADILVLQFGETEAIVLLSSIVEEAGSEWRRRHAN
ncbi:hypothetical protein BSY17_244 [Sphingobium sp. RAC03]|nr:hypothetical protein BSY17_244 [Sphingobium sp. RAC03]